VVSYASIDASGSPASPVLFQGLGLARYPLDRLTHVTLKYGEMLPTDLVLFLQAHAGRLRYVSLVNCLVVESLMTTLRTASKSDTDAWLHVLWTLTKLPRLAHLHLDHLRAYETSPTTIDERFSEEDALVHSFDESKTFSVNWKGTQEISTGLKYLIGTYQFRAFVQQSRV
jgi:hypothetical protein